MHQANTKGDIWSYHCPQPRSLRPASDWWNIDNMRDAQETSYDVSWASSMSFFFPFQLFHITKFFIIRYQTYSSTSAASFDGHQEVWLQLTEKMVALRGCHTVMMEWGAKKCPRDFDVSWAFGMFWYVFFLFFFFSIQMIILNRLWVPQRGWCKAITKTRMTTNNGHGAWDARYVYFFYFFFLY